MRRTIILIFCVFLCSVSCCRENNALAMLDRAAELMADQPEEALSVIAAIDARHVSSRSAKARYALLYSQALDKNYIDVDNDSLIRVAVDYYGRKGTDHEKALAYYYLGCVYSNGYESDKAIVALKEAETYADQTDDHYLMGLINSCIGILYQENYDYEEAIKRYEKSAMCFGDAGVLNNMAIAISKEANAYYAIGENDLAKNNWAKVLEICRGIGNKAGLFETKASLLAIKIQQDEAVEVLKSEFRRLCVDYYGIPLPPQEVTLWFSLFKKNGELDSARLCGQIFFEHYAASVPDKVLGMNAQMMYLEQEAGRYKEALDYALTTMRMNDSLAIVSNESDIKELEQLYNNQLLQKDLETSRLRQKIQRITFALFLIVALVISVAAMRWGRKIKEEQNNTKVELDNLHQIYNDLVSRHTSIEQLLDQHNESEVKIYKAIEERLSGLHQLIEKLPTTKPTDFVKEFRKYASVNTNSHYALLDLQYVVNQKYFGIIDYLKSGYPGLTKYDLDLCALMCFGFSHTGICYLYDYSDVGSFYNKRSRLRRKLQLPPDYKIEDFIQSTIAKLRSKKL